MNANNSGIMPGIAVLDSITKLSPGDRGKVVVAASHGGVNAAHMAALGGARAVILHDAGIGKDGAGVSGLAELDKLDMAAAAVSHASARIGDGQDLIDRGRISHVNGSARALGCAAGQSCLDCARDLIQATTPSVRPAPAEEGRFLFGDNPGKPRVWGIDSASLVRSEDRGDIVITGSHGGLLGGDPATALRIDALAAVYNDAGIGIDGAGISRLPALDARGIAAATVAAMSARIGDARSSYQDGRLSHVNETAAAAGCTAGMGLSEFVSLIIKSRG